MDAGRMVKNPAPFLGKIGVAIKMIRKHVRAKNKPLLVMHITLKPPIWL
jgi:hypothetical protein